MQEVRFGKKEKSNIIDINDVKEDATKIYCFHDGNTRELVFLTLANYSDSKKYAWTTLEANRGGYGCAYRTIKDALKFLDGCKEIKVIIFDSQCEVLKYAKENLT